MIQSQKTNLTFQFKYNFDFLNLKVFNKIIFIESDLIDTFYQFMKTSKVCLNEVKCI